MRDARPAELGRCPILIHKVRSGFLISRVKGAVIDHQLIIIVLLGLSQGRSAHRVGGHEGCMCWVGVGSLSRVGDAN